MKNALLSPIFFFSILAFNLLVTGSSAGAQTASGRDSDFIRARLPDGISIDVPSGWHYLGPDGKRAVETYAESMWDLTKIPHGPAHALLEVTAPENVGYISIAVVLEYRDTATQQMLKAIPGSQLSDIDKQNRQDIEAGSTFNGLKILSWDGTMVEQVNGYWAMVKRYVYTLPGQPARRMMNCEFFLGNRVVSLLLQTGENTLVPARPILEKVKTSITFE